MYSPQRCSYIRFGRQFAQLQTGYEDLSPPTVDELIIAKVRRLQPLDQMPKPILEVTLTKFSTSWSIVLVRPPPARQRSKVCMRGWAVYQGLHLLCILPIFAHTDEQRLVRPLSEYNCSRFITMEETKLYRITVDIRLRDFGSTFKLLETISMELAVSLGKTRTLFKSSTIFRRSKNASSGLDIARSASANVSWRREISSRRASLALR